MAERHEGGCVCGSVRYATLGEPVRVTVCHCTWCQRREGFTFRHIFLRSAQRWARVPEGVEKFQEHFAS